MQTKERCSSPNTGELHSRHTWNLLSAKGYSWQGTVIGQTRPLPYSRLHLPSMRSRTRPLIPTSHPFFGLPDRCLPLQSVTSIAQEALLPAQAFNDQTAAVPLSRLVSSSRTMVMATWDAVPMGIPVRNKWHPARKPTSAALEVKAAAVVSQATAAAA